MSFRMWRKKTSVDVTAAPAPRTSRTSYRVVSVPTRNTKAERRADLGYFGSRRPRRTGPSGQSLPHLESRILPCASARYPPRRRVGCGLTTLESIPYSPVVLAAGIYSEIRDFEEENSSICQHVRSGQRSSERAAARRIRRNVRSVQLKAANELV